MEKEQPRKPLKETEKQESLEDSLSEDKRRVYSRTSKMDSLPEEKKILIQSTINNIRNSTEGQAFIAGIRKDLGLD